VPSLPILDDLSLQYLFGVAEICTTLFSARFFIFFSHSYGPLKFNEAATFHPLCAQKSAKIPYRAIFFAKLLLFS
jgi:hypothetical protein